MNKGKLKLYLKSKPKIYYQLLFEVYCNEVLPICKVTRLCTFAGSQKLTGLPRWHSGKEFACQCRRPKFNSWVGKIPWRRKWQPAPVFLPGEFHGQRSLPGYSPWGRKELDTMEWLTLSLSLSLHVDLKNEKMEISKKENEERKSLILN